MEEEQQNNEKGYDQPPFEKPKYDKVGEVVKGLCAGLAVESLLLVHLLFILLFLALIVVSFIKINRHFGFGVLIAAAIPLIAFGGCILLFMRNGI